MKGIFCFLRVLIGILGISLIFCPGGFAIAVSEEPASMPAGVAGKTQIFDLDYSVHFTNPFKESISIKIKVPQIQDHGLHQQVLDCYILPQPLDIEKGEKGNFYIFAWKDIAPGETVKCRIICRLLTRRLLWNIDPDQITKTSGKTEKEYLKGDSRYPTQDPIVKEKLNSILGKEKNPYYQALKIYDYVRNMNFKMEDKPSNVISSLKSDTCQCADASDVFITLCRSAGIPARFYGGIYLKESENQTGETHAWAEIYLNPYGWVPVDPTMGRFDYATRLSRFAEMDSPYIMLWLDDMNPLTLEYNSPEFTLSPQNFKVDFIYKFNGERAGIEVRDLVPNLNFSFPRTDPPNLLTGNKEAVELFKKSQNQDTFQAKSLLIQAVKKDPSFALPYRKLIQIYYDENNSQEIREILEEQRAKTGETTGTAGIAYGLGVLDTLEGNYATALENLNLAEDLGIPSFIIYHNKALFYSKSKQIYRSFIYFHKALTENPYGMETYRQTIELLEYLEDDKGIVNLCQEGLKHLNDSFFHYRMAQAYINMKNFSEAEKSVNIAIKMNPNQAFPHGILAWIYHQKGETQKAREEYAKAQKMGLTPNEKEFLDRKMKKVIK